MANNPWERIQRATLGDDVDDLVEMTRRAEPRVLRYTDWAVSALADLTAIACELSDSKLQEMERDRVAVAYGSTHRIAKDSAERALGSYPDLEQRGRHNLRQLRELGAVPWGAGLATVAQGVQFPEFVPRLVPLARSWRQAGFRFPVAPFVVWHPHVPLTARADR